MPTPVEYSQVKIDDETLARLALLARADRKEFFSRHPEIGRIYSDRVICIALCQGAALHYVNGHNGVKDFDVWTFFARHPRKSFPVWVWRRKGRADFGPSRFGTNPFDEGYIGRRVDFMMRDLVCDPGADPVVVLRHYFSSAPTKSARELAKKVAVLLQPRRGFVVWPLPSGER